MYLNNTRLEILTFNHIFYVYLVLTNQMKPSKFNPNIMLKYLCKTLCKTLNISSNICLRTYNVILSYKLICISIYLEKKTVIQFLINSSIKLVKCIK